jgi:hypothetical protein
MTGVEDMTGMGIEDMTGVKDMTGMGIEDMTGVKDMTGGEGQRTTLGIKKRKESRTKPQGTAGGLCFSHCITLDSRRTFSQSLR